MEKEDTKKKTTTTSKKKKKKEENKIVKVAIMVGIVIVAMICGFLFASATDNTCEVAFNQGDSVKESVVKVEKNTKVLRPADPTREGYDFVGWYLDGVKFDFDTEITKDITLTAIWSESAGQNVPVTPDIVTYTVTFDSNGGSAIAAQTVEENEVATEPAKPTKSGYTFAGWYLGDTKYSFGTKVTKDITLTAKWTKVEEEKDKETSSADKETTTVTKYTVKFDSNGGSKVSSKTVVKGKTVSKPSNPTRSGYTFLGWYLGSKEFDFSTKITKNITLEAKWKKNDVITWTKEKVPNSVVNQVRVYILLNGKKVSGTADVVNTQGQTVTRSIPASGWLTVDGTISTLKNIKVN